MKTLLPILLALIAAPCLLAFTMDGGGGDPDKPAKIDVRISRIAMAVVNMDAMVKFYREVFGVEFTSFPIDDKGTMLHEGAFAGIPLILAPNSIAGVTAEQSRHQFDLVVSDLDRILELTVKAGGAVRDQPTTSGTTRTAVILDPDGNTTVVIEEGAGK